LIQSFTDFEYIIIFDNPADNKLANFLRDFCSKEKRIKLFLNSQNIGLTKSLNKAIKKAKGEFIARLDAGDLSFPDRFKIQTDYLNKNKDVFLVGSSAIFIDESDNEMNRFYAESDIIKLKKILENKNRIIHSSIMFRNKDLYYREKFYLAQDYDFYLCRISEGKKIANIENFLIKFRVEENSLSQKKRFDQIFYSELAKKFYKQRIKSGFDDYEKFNSFNNCDSLFKSEIEKKYSIDYIKNLIKRGDLKESRAKSREYIVGHGFNSEVLLLFFLSFLGNFLIKKFMKIFKLV
jgi:glycosyltransferase involved in cell wall biosynthesis